MAVRFALGGRRARTNDEKSATEEGIISSIGASNPWSETTEDSAAATPQRAKSALQRFRSLGSKGSSLSVGEGSTSSLTSSLTNPRRNNWIFAKSKTSSRNLSDRISMASNARKVDGAAKVSRTLGDTVTSVVISEDRQLIAACSTNKKALVLNCRDGSVVAEFTADSPLNASAIGLTGQRARLIVGAFSGKILVYHIASNKKELELQFGTGSNAINCMAIAASATRLAVGGKAQHVLLYALSLTDEAVGMNVLYTFPTHGANTLALSLDAAAEKLVAGGESKVVQMWQIPKPRAASNALGMAGGCAPMSPQRVSLSQNAAHESTPGTDEAARSGSNNASPMGRRNAQEEELLPRVQFRTSSTIHSIALDYAGATLAVGTSEHTEIYRIIERKDPLRPHVPPEYVCEPLTILECPAMNGGVAFSHRGQLAIGGNHLASVFDLETGGMLVKNETEDRVRCVAISNDGEALVIGGFDKRVHLKMIESGTRLYHFSYDGKAMVKSVSAAPSRLPDRLLSLRILLASRSATCRVTHAVAHLPPPPAGAPLFRLAPPGDGM